MKEVHKTLNEIQRIPIMISSSDGKGPQNIERDSTKTAPINLDTKNGFPQNRTRFQALKAEDGHNAF